MGPLQEILVNFVFDESIERVTDFLRLRVGHFLRRVNLEALLLVPHLVRHILVSSMSGPFSWSLHLPVLRASLVPAIRIITVIEFVRVYKASLVFGLGIGLDELIGELAFQRLVVRRATSFLRIGNKATASHGRSIEPD